MSVNFKERVDVRKILRQLEDILLKISVDNKEFLIMESELESKLFHEGIRSGEDELEVYVKIDGEDVEYKIEIEVEYLTKDLEVEVDKKSAGDERFTRTNELPELVKSSDEFRATLEKLSKKIDSMEGGSFGNLFGD